ncbi:MAG: hypothetical protein P9X27_02295 [Candidatus Kaelpia aquatica]|nr:hypothetical protein [Candidatus Kaelpia aquatica]
MIIENRKSIFATAFICIFIFQSTVVGFTGPVGSQSSGIIPVSQGIGSYQGENTLSMVSDGWNDEWNIESAPIEGDLRYELYYDDLSGSLVQNIWECCDPLWALRVEMEAMLLGMNMDQVNKVIREKKIGDETYKFRLKEQKRINDVIEIELGDYDRDGDSEIVSYRTSDGGGNFVKFTEWDKSYTLDYRNIMSKEGMLLVDLNDQTLNLNSVATLLFSEQHSSIINHIDRLMDDDPEDLLLDFTATSNTTPYYDADNQCIIIGGWQVLSDDIDRSQIPSKITVDGITFDLNLVDGLFLTELKVIDGVVTPSYDRDDPDKITGYYTKNSVEILDMVVRLKAWDRLYSVEYATDVYGDLVLEVYSDGNTVEWQAGDLSQGFNVDAGSVDFEKTYYNKETNNIVKEVWASRSTLPSGNIPSQIELDNSSIELVSGDSSVLVARYEKHLDNVMDILISDDGNRIDYMDSASRTIETVLLSSVIWDKNYSLAYNEVDGRVEVSVNGRTIDAAVRSLEQDPAGSSNIPESDNVNQLIAMMIDESSSEQRHFIMQQIGELGTEYDLELAQDISDIIYADEGYIRFDAAMDLMDAADLRSAEALIRVCFEIEELEGLDRDMAAQALAAMVLPKSITDRFVAAAIENKGNVSRFYLGNAFLYLGLQADYSLIDFLFNNAGSEAAGIASDIMAAYGSSSVVEPLIRRLLISNDSTARELAFKTLYSIGKSAVEPIVKDILSSGDSELVELGIEALAKIKDLSVNPLIDALMLPEVISNNYYVDNIKNALIRVGNPSFIPVLSRLLNNENRVLQNLAVDIITAFDPSEVDSSIDLRNLKSLVESQNRRGLDSLNVLSSNYRYSLTRAVALYYVKDAEFLKEYLFKSSGNTLIVRSKMKDSLLGDGVSKLEMAAILNTGIPSQEGWWYNLKNKSERIEYLKLVLKGDFTDERTYITSFGYGFLCRHFAKQLMINSLIYEVDDFVDGRDELYDLEGGINPYYESLSYGLPIRMANSLGNMGDGSIGHAFNAIYVGDLPFDVGKYDINNWVCIEPQDDGFMPASLFEKTTIDLNTYMSTCGSLSFCSVNLYQDLVTLNTAGYDFLPWWW